MSRYNKPLFATTMKMHTNRIHIKNKEYLTLRSRDVQVYRPEDEKFMINDYSNVSLKRRSESLNNENIFDSNKFKNGSFQMILNIIEKSKIHDPLNINQSNVNNSWSIPTHHIGGKVNKRSTEGKLRSKGR